jgi:hypothetical protein
MCRKVTELTGDDRIVTVYTGDDLAGDGTELTVRAPVELDIERGDPLWLTVDDHRVLGFDGTGERIDGKQTRQSEGIKR